ncbi:MAG: hypothetical protein RMH84_06735 [Sulfolobales archaeon]|nr:hypothetical protein [Sulfolobales archaeon]MDW8011267.1 hypothetical protein [Sulfolobales archaeon]
MKVFKWYLPQFRGGAMADCVPVVKLSSGREIAVTKEVVALLNRYVHSEFSLEKLAADLGVEDWSEAYEFIKKVPAWVMWIQPTYYEKVVLKKLCSSS